MKRYFFIISIIFLLILSPVSEGKFIYSTSDPAGDDYGPGTYEYPTQEVFKPYQGLFDITSFKIYEPDNNYYLLKIKMGKITNPWDKKHGFSFPLIELYLDTKEGGSTKPFRKGARVRFTDKHPWNKLIKISGEWIRVFTPSDNKKEIIDLSSGVVKSDWDLKDYEVSVSENTISIKLRQEVLGPLLKNVYLYVLVGGYNPFGEGYYRDVKAKPSSWSFSDSTHSDLNNAPRVIDIMLPQDMKQKNILGDFKQDYPVVYPLEVADDNILYELVRDYLVSVLLVLLLIYVLWHVFTHNNDDLQEALDEELPWNKNSNRK